MALSELLMIQSVIHALMIPASLAFSHATLTQPPEMFQLWEEFTDSFELLFAPYYSPTVINEPDTLQEVGFQMKVLQICKCKVSFEILFHWRLSRYFHFCSTWHLLAAQILLAEHTHWHWHGYWHSEMSLFVFFIEWWWVRLCVSIQEWLGNGGGWQL